MADLPIRLDLTVYQGTDQYERFRLESDSLPAPIWRATTVYAAGEYASPTVANGYTYLVITGGTSGGSEPAAPTVLGQRFADGTVSWMAVGSRRLINTSAWGARANIRTAADAVAEELEMTTENGLIEKGIDPPPRENSTAYDVGQQVVPSVMNGWVYQCVTAGTSDSSSPTWPTGEGQTVTDGTVVWRNVGSDEVATNLRIALVPTITDALDNWGSGVWDLEVINDFAQVQRLFEGTCVLSQQVTRA